MSMPRAGKLLMFAGLARGMYDHWRLRHLMTGLLAAVVTMVIAAILISALVVTGFYAGYLVMIHYGIPQQTAFGITACVMALTALVLILVMQAIVRRMRMMVMSKTPGTRAGEVIDAFFDGLLAE